MSLFDTDRSSQRTPVTLFTGFLGAGKTTLINRLLAHPGMERSLVIVNEFGTIALDHLFIESRDTDLVMLSSGCICCTVRGDLELTLRDMAARQQSGDLPPFDRVLIETTGLADPAPIAALFFSHPMVMHDFRLEAIVTLVDAVNGPRQLDGQAEATAQVAIADLVVMTKTDIAPAEAAAELDIRLRRLAPGARRERAVAGAIAPVLLFGGPGHRLPFVEDTWAGHAAGCADPACGHPEHGSRHGAGIRAVTIVHDRPLPWDRLNYWFRGLRATWADGLLRMKGLLAVEEEPGPLVVHGIHATFHPPVALAEWPDEDRRTRIVLILKGIDPAEVVASFHEAVNQPVPAE